MMLCDVCDHFKAQSECVIYNIYGGETLCQECDSLVGMMSRLDQHQPSQPQPRSSTTTTTTTDTRKPRPDTIITLLDRIHRHPLYQQLDQNIRYQLQQIARFDRRRNKQDNQYVRDVYSWLHPQQSVAV